MMKRLLYLICALCIAAASLIPQVYADDNLQSGKCGDNLKWEYYINERILRISGTGKMYDYDKCDNPPPWKDNVDMTSVKICKGVTMVGDYAFADCKSLESADMEAVSSIGEGAFSGCENLGYAGYGDRLISIGDAAFSGCSRLSVPKWPDTLREIGFSAYSGCECLGLIDLPEGITKISEAAFSGCTYLTDIEFPSTLTEIGAGAFFKCKNLYSIELPPNLYSIGDAAFSNCLKLTKIKFPDSLTEMGSMVFENLKNDVWYNEQPEGLIYAGNVAYKYKGTPNTNLDLVLKDGTTGIASGAFTDNAQLISITMPDTVSAIGSMAFINCVGLKEIKIPPRVSRIESSTFNGCKKLKKAIFPEEMEEIGNNAFNCCIKLKDIVLPKGLNKIGDNSFADCYSLANIYYTGTKGDWEKTVIGKGNTELKTDKLITEYDRSIKVRGRINSCAYEGGKINVTADIDYTSQNCKAVLAVYYGRRLIAAEYKDLNEGAKSVSFSVDSSENTGLTAKVLFWESDLITPIAKPISAEVK